MSRPSRRPGRLRLLLAPAAGSVLVMAAPALPAFTPAALAGPVLCTTSLEAPHHGMGTAPVEVSRCGVIQTPPELMERRFYSFTAPFTSGVNLTHQITDLFGLAVPGWDRGVVKGFGFTDQAHAWDGAALENTTAVLLDEQSLPTPLRTNDLPTGFGSSLGQGGGRGVAQQRGLW